MKEKIIKIIDNLITISLILLLSFGIVDKGMYRDENIFLYTITFLVPIILYLIKYFMNPYKISKKYIMYILFLLPFLIPIIFKSAVLPRDTIYHFIYMVETIILCSIISKEYKNSKDKLYRIILFSVLFGLVVSLTSLFTTSIIPNNYGDFYKSSVDRLYGTLVYPNALALLSILGIIISFSFISKNKLYFIPLYISLLVFSLTMSKSLFLFIIFVFIVLIYKYKKNTIYLLSIFPLIYNVKIYRNMIIDNNLILFIIITILCILLSYVLILIYNKNKKLLILLLGVFFLSVTIFPKKELIIKSNKESNIILTDFMYLEDNKDYTLYIETDKKSSSTLLVSKKYLVKNRMASDIIASSQVNKTNYIKFNTGENAEYFTLELYNKNKNLKIKKVKLISDDISKEITLDYKYYPYNYIKMFEQTKYDVGSLTGRIFLYKEALKMVKESPIKGHGYKYFKEVTLSGQTNHQAIEEHSFILTLMVENGIFSSIMWIILLVYIYYLLIRNIKDDYGVINFLLISSIVFSSCYDFTLSYNYFLIILFSLSMLLDNKKNKDLLLICSAGGHLTAMLKLESIFMKKDYVLITEKNSISKAINGYNLEYVIYSSKHKLLHYLLVTPINILKYLFYLIYYNPKVIITTGSHNGVFMCYLGKLFRKKVIFIEVFDRYRKLTLSGKLTYRIADKFIVQQKTLKEIYPKSIYIGGMY